MRDKQEIEAASAQRAEELFRAHQHEIFCKTDTLFARLMLFQWAAGILAALLISPLTWNGVSSQVHIHVWAAIFLGGAITIFPVWLTRVWPGAALTRHAIAVAQMLMSALLIGLSGGRIETHFHVFGSLVILSFYRDWRVLIPATLVVGLDHFLRGIYWPYSVYGVLAASPWRSVEHAGWVVFEDVFLVISCLRSIREMRSIANRTAALEASEQNFRQIFKEAPIGMAVVGLDERFQKANTAFCEMLDYSEEELMQRTPFEITYQDDLALTRQMAQVMFDGNGSHRVEKRYLRKSGKIVWTTRTGCMIRDEAGQPRHFLIMVEDISERKRSEEALREAKNEADRANRAKSEFLSRMSHELRTPLNAILGFSQLLQRQNPSETQRARIDHIVSAGRHLLDLINEVLDISRIEAGRMQLSLDTVRVADAVHDTLELMRPLAAERKISLAASPQIERTLSVWADAQRLKQVLLNLVSNAVKYTPVGGEVSISAEGNNHENVRIAVKDNGAGIPAQKLARLFTPFDRLGAEFSSVQGSGLGLALCRRLMDAMQGTIAVESSVGRGSKFIIELPRAESNSSASGAAKLALPSIVPPPKNGERCKVLYIEDNVSNLNLVEQLLEHQPSIELITATRGNIGLDLARRVLPDLILLDLHLPDLPGWEVLAQLQASDATRHIPAVVISADATARQIEQLMSAGARAYLTKPLDLAEFYRVLEEASARVKECVAA